MSSPPLRFYIFFQMLIGWLKCMICLVVNAINRLFYQLCFAPTESCIDLYSFHHGVCSICTLHQSLPTYLPTSDGFIQEVQLHLRIISLLCLSHLYFFFLPMFNFSIYLKSFQRVIFKKNGVNNVHVFLTDI
jgi:hypothetical protein